MSEANNDTREQGFKFFSTEGSQWLLRYGCFPIILALIAGVAAILTARTIQGPLWFFEETPTPVYTSPPEIKRFEVTLTADREWIQIIWEVSEAKHVSLENTRGETISQEADGKIFERPILSNDLQTYTLTAGNGIEPNISAIRQLPIALPTTTPTPTASPTISPTPISTSTPTITPSPTATPVVESRDIVPRPLPFVPPSWAACVNHGENPAGWRAGDTLPESGCICQTGNLFCCPPIGQTEGWWILPGAILPIDNNQSISNSCSSEVGTTEPIVQLADILVSELSPPETRCFETTGTCEIELNFIIINAGTGDADGFLIDVMFDPEQFVQTQSEGLIAGETQTLIVSAPDAGSCYNPNCTIRINC